MKVFLTIFLIAVFVGGGYLAFTRINKLGTSTQAIDLNVTLVGKIVSVKGNSQYSFQLEGGNKITGLNSSRLNLTAYINKNVSVTGQYSGDVLYVDEVEVQK